MRNHTLGVEEEYQIVSPEDRGLSSSAERVLEQARKSLADGEIEPEMHASQIEVVTSVCRTLSEVRAELVRLRRGISKAAEAEGVRIAAASTHPFSRWEEQKITPKERYKKLVEREKRLAEEQVVFGFHVHVGLEDRELALMTLNRARVWLAPILALSANSPFWLGEDTGYASYRTQVWGRTPTAGPPEHFESLAEYEDLVEALAGAGVTSDATQIYWDIRLPEKVETVELRVADVCARINEAVMIAGLSRALVGVCRELAERNEPYAVVRPALLRGAIWGASRHGLDGKLIDLNTRRAVPARDLIDKLLAFVRPALEEEGDWDEVSSLARETLDRGNGASRQRAAYEKTGSLADVVDMLSKETKLGL